MASKQNFLKQWLLSALKLLVAAGLITWLILSGKLDLQSLKKINHWSAWFFGSGLFLLGLLFNSLRWQMLLQVDGVEISFKEALKLSLIGIFFNFVVPGGVGGDVVKGGYLFKSFTKKKMFISWSILVDRLMGLAAMLTYSGVAGMLFYQHLKPSLQNSFFTFSLFFLLGLVFTAIVVAFVPKQGIEDFLLKHPISEKFLYPLFFFIKKPSKIVIPFFLSFGGQAMMVAIVYGLGLYLHVDIPWWYFLILVPYGFIATILPISPAGLGVGQMAFYYLFQQTLEQGEFGILAITFYQASQFIVGLGGGLLFVLYKKEVSDG